MQTGAAQPIIARKMLWEYRGIDENARDRDFFITLGAVVTEEIARRTRQVRLWIGRELRLQVGVYTLQARLINIEPPLATAANEATYIIARYDERSEDEGQDTATFLAEIIRYPDPALGTIFDTLVGLDEIKEDLFRKLTLLISPGYIETWAAGAYPTNPPLMLMQALRDRYPLIILEGAVGAGKTALARSIGDRLASRLNTELALFIVNAQVRGGGHVGELTQNISRAFMEAERCQEREQIPVLLLIDEADALAQARGSRQTHHEDDAGVNTLIQRIDRLRGRPMAVIFATNRVQSLDAALLRRAVSSYHFDRPTAEQRNEVFLGLLANTGLEMQDIAHLVALTEPRPVPCFGETKHRYTYSDLSQRIIPRAVEVAVYAQQPLSLEHLSDACRTVLPTVEDMRERFTER